MLAHNVFFTLIDNSEESRQRLLAAIRKYLTGYPGEVFFAAGALCTELRREVNDLDFDIALHIVFRTKADQDAYQVAPRHEQFIQENQSSWKRVRVFDSVVEGA